LTPLEIAVSIAVQTHQGQNEKSGMPYVLHPIRLVVKMEAGPELITTVLKQDYHESALAGSRIHLFFVQPKYTQG